MKSRVFLSMILAGLWAMNVFACRCLPTTIAEHVAKNNLIFVGKVELASSEDMKNIYQISVEKILKNQTSVRDLKQVTASSGHHSCGLNLKVEDKLLFVVNYQDGEVLPLHTCQKNIFWDETIAQNGEYQEILRILGQ